MHDVCNNRMKSKTYKAGEQRGETNKQSFKQVANSVWTRHQLQLVAKSRKHEQVTAFYLCWCVSTNLTLDMTFLTASSHFGGGGGVSCFPLRHFAVSLWQRRPTSHRFTRVALICAECTQSFPLFVHCRWAASSAVVCRVFPFKPPDVWATRAEVNKAQGRNAEGEKMVCDIL